MLIYGILASVFISLSQQYDPYYQGCSYVLCNYYAKLSHHPYLPSLKEAGLRLYYQCRCEDKGVSLAKPTEPPYIRHVPFMKIPQTRSPTTTQLPTRPPPPSQSRECGNSLEAGPASHYLNRKTARIVGGQVVAECRFPWIVYLNISGTYMCGGSIVDSNHIVTAAHCLRSKEFDYTADSIRVGVGSSQRSHLQYYNVRRVAIHPNFRKAGFHFDIAVLTLSSSLPTNNPCIKPICLPTPSLELKTGTRCIVAGWGLTAQFNKKIPDRMQEAVVPVVSTEQCKQAYGEDTVDNFKFCAGYIAGGIDSCRGDSGGPLMCAAGDYWVLAGTVSYGYGCAKPKYPGVYAYVPNLKTWVDYILRLY